jgi:tRNA threonylcarbamoyladenosine biosynthesis protein TsaB
VILAFDTATRATTVALSGLGPGELEARDDPAPGQRPGHGTRLMPLAVDLLSRAGIGWKDLDRLAVGVGPGTFTGLRIGIATARALALALELPLVGVSTLQSLAMNSFSYPAMADLEAVAAVLDARRGEVFAAIWPAGQIAGQAALVEPHATAPEALADTIAGMALRTQALGEGAVEFRGVLERSGALIPEDDSELHRVTAINHCRLATGLGGSAPDHVQPEYLRLPDAEIARRAAGKP